MLFSSSPALLRISDIHTRTPTTSLLLLLSQHRPTPGDGDWFYCGGGGGDSGGGGGSNLAPVSFTWIEVGAFRISLLDIPIQRPLPGVGYLWWRARIHSRIGGHFGVQTSIGAEREQFTNLQLWVYTHTLTPRTHSARQTWLTDWLIRSRRRRRGEHICPPREWVPTTTPCWFPGEFWPTDGTTQMIFFHMQFWVELREMTVRAKQ